MIYRQDIQILRGVAVLMVVLFHLQIPFFDNGFLGVDVFFVISGFLMAKLYDKGTIADFYRRRIDRLLPAYSFTVIAVVIAAYYLLIPVDFSQLYEQALASIFYLNNIHFWNQNSYFDKASFNPLLHLWSLSVEAQFYLIVPFLYPLLRKRKGLTIIVFFLTLAACVAIQTISPKTSFFLMPFRIWEFLVGAWVAWYSREGREGISQNLNYQILFLALLVISFFVIPLKPDSGSIVLGHPSLAALVMVLLTGLIIYYRMPKAFESSAVGRSLAIVGDYSYSIYLVHFPIIVLWNYREFGGTILGSDSILRFSAIVLSIAAASYLSYGFIEKRISSYFRASIPRIALLLGIFLASSATVHLNESKFNETQKNIFSAWTDRSVYRCGKIFRVLNPTKEICMVSDEDKDRRILLVGNSHADSIKTSFAKVANNKGLSLYFIVQNDPLVGSQLDANKIVKEAKALGIDYIAIHFSNNIYDTPEDRACIESLVDLSHKHGIEVIIISPVPTYEVHIPQAMYQAKNGVYSFEIDRSQHNIRTSGYRAFSNGLAARNIAIYDPAEILCPTEGSCSFADATNKPYYFDSSHLTLTGATQLESLFNKAIEGIGKR
ncbi:acyltransferase family protein [Nitrosomonas sp.]|uniref:acyltransferase family protein n=1 Tax=Nitrosomonas sp. TaxID=42353 RepID=UPI00272FD4D6|nr:acyltransferase family protein [Nitrosomonas sp.]MDP1787899.1 acyltransferase family protein [Nitrosomonas sp.]